MAKKRRRPKRQPGALGVKSPKHTVDIGRYGKNPAMAASPSNDTAKIILSFKEYDGGKNWGSRTNRNDCPHVVLSRLRDVENMTWQELKVHDPNFDHHCNPDKISKDAKKRISQIRIDDFDELWRLRVSTKGRVWGVRRASVFWALWWDPNHAVYPSKTRN